MMILCFSPHSTHHFRHMLQALNITSNTQFVFPQCPRHGRMICPDGHCEKLLQPIAFMENPGMCVPTSRGKLSITRISQFSTSVASRKAAGDQSLEPALTKANSKTYASLLRSSGNAKALSDIKRIHANMIQSGYQNDTFLCNLLVQMYGKCGHLQDALCVFDAIHQKNLFSWTIVIAAYAQNGHYKEALHIFREMDLEGVKPDDVVFLTVMPACSSLADLAQAKTIHARVASQGYDSLVVVATALVNMFAKSGSMDDARNVFDRMGRKDEVCWSIMIAAYAQHGRSEEALELYARMRSEHADIKADEVVFLSALAACSGMGSFAEGKLIHAHVVSDGFTSNIVVGNALVNMYSKCGSLTDALGTFKKMPEKDVISWNAITAAFSRHGLPEESVEAYKQMLLDGVEPSDITFTCLLHALSHTGLLSRGRSHFISITADHYMAPIAEHFVCMIDLLGRAGQLALAKDLINHMPFQPDTVAWEALLGVCEVHRDAKQGMDAVQRIFDLKPENYVTLANIYAAVAGR